MRNCDLRDYYFTFCLLLLSLTPVYFFSLQVASLLGLFFSILMLGIFWKSLHLTNHSIVLLYVFLFLVTSLMSASFLLDVDIKRVIAFFLLISSSLTASMLVQKVNIKRVVLSFLAIHCFFFYLQFFAYFIFNVYIDYLGLIGLEARNFGGTFTLPLINKMMRASGLFNEPGTYATFVAPVVALSMRYISSLNNKFIPYAALLSLSLTLSTFGFVFSVIILTFTPIKRTVKLLISAVFGLFSIPYLYWRFFVRSQEGISTGMGFREEFMRATIDSLSEFGGIFHGHGGFSSIPYAFSDSGAVNDSGLIFTLLYYFGLIPTVFFVIPLLLLSFFRGVPAFSMTVIIFISKINFFALIVPFYFVLALQADFKNSKSVENVTRR